MEQMTLFDERQEMVPLATRLRPSSLEEFAGQEHLLEKDIKTADRKGSDFLHDLLGSSRSRQDDTCQYYCRENKSRVH